jgi:hypothetical protein
MDAVPGLRQAVANEYRCVVRPPWEIPTVLVTNGALMLRPGFYCDRAHATVGHLCTTWLFFWSMINFHAPVMILLPPRHAQTTFP